MEYKEDDYLMLSGIQHFKFCRRQWALIHIEQQWAENVHTVIGELMHKKVHDPMSKEKRKDTIIVRALPIASRKMGISGECDVVEFHKCEDGISLFGHRGLYSVFPVEYKKGKEKEVITFYVTDDKNHLPVRLDLYLNFGSAKAFLREIKGNRHPLTSIIEK